MLPMEGWRADFDERFPIYQQIINRFSRSLVKGELHTEDRIPSIRDLAVALGVNTNTIQRAFQEMERDGLIFSQRGTGYFVMNDETLVERIKSDMVRESTIRFLEEMRALGFENKQILDELQRQLEKGETGHELADNQGA